MFIACDAFRNVSQIWIADCDFCQEFNHWRELRSFGIAVDFRRILRFGYELGELKDYEINVRIFEAVSALDVFDRVMSERYLRHEDDLGLVVKYMPRCKSMEYCGIELKLDKLLNMCHPCIAAPIGFVLPDELSESRELKIVRLYVEGISLSEMISMNPVWWTATAKAKAVIGIVLGLRYAHSLGLIHGHLNSRNILFDSDDRIEITDFGVMSEEFEENESGGDVGVVVGGFSGERWSSKIDIEGFVSILIEILVGHPATQSDISNGEMIFPADVPMFVLKMISGDQSDDRGISESFNDIFDLLKKNVFKILSGVDSAEVLSFVTWIEWLEW
jgi:serine/threonine protein kinase